MKRIVVLFVVFVMSAAASMAQQRDCHSVVLPLYGNDEEAMADLPAGKLAWHCAFSYNSFDVVDELPQDAIVYDIATLQRVSDSVAVGADFVVDLNTLSVYAYNFDQFRYKHTGLNVYFRTPSSAHKYLLLRPYLDAMERTAEELDK